MHNTVNLLNGLELLYPENTFIPQLKRTLDMFPESEIPMQDALSLGQLSSKLWLIEKLPENLGTVFICAGWYGTLAALMFERARSKFDKIRSFDIDHTCAPIADTMNRPWVMDGWQFKASTLDILEMDYPTEHTTYRANGTSLELCEMPDTIINTSCEHIADFVGWYNKIPVGKLVVLQANDYHEVEEHVNTYNTLEEFTASAPMTTILYEGELKLPKYTRFMKIGFR
jgi:hypothetical protein